MMIQTNQEFQVFRKTLQQALTHLFDPVYAVPDVLTLLISQEEGQLNALRSLLINEIKELAQGSDTSENSRTHRSQSILSLRYIDGLSQEKTAELLQMSLRSLQRAQRQAVLILAYRLWTLRSVDKLSDDITFSAEEWRSQLDQEINLLSQSTADAQSDLTLVMQAVNRITTARSPKRYGLSISLKEEHLRCPFHAPVLQQILLSLLDCIMDRAPIDELQLIGKRLDDDTIRIKVIGGHPDSEEPLDLTLVQSLLSMQQGSNLEILQADPLALALDIPLVQTDTQHYTILFVDDNADLAVLFTTYCTGTHYELVHVDKGALAAQRISKHKPDVVILDVMLPDVDGWELLISLKADPATAAIPVIVCSVITDSDLAIDLGADLYLQKPVWREKFLEAVDKVLVSEK